MAVYSILVLLLVIYNPLVAPLGLRFFAEDRWAYMRIFYLLPLMPVIAYAVTDYYADTIDITEKKERKINRVRCDIQSHIIAAGYTQKEAVEACSAEYGWSDSDSNFSAKLSDQTLRYREVLELADVLGYEIVWQKRRED